MTAYLFAGYYYNEVIIYAYAEGNEFKQLEIILSQSLQVKMLYLILFNFLSFCYIIWIQNEIECISVNMSFLVYNIQ